MERNRKRYPAHETPSRPHRRRAGSWRVAKEAQQEEYYRASDLDALRLLRIFLGGRRHQGGDLGEWGKQGEVSPHDPAASEVKPLTNSSLLSPPPSYHVSATTSSSAAFS
ncbi:hypothetical protein E2C01_052951 [Portunus trituberculatus]|uniref:Uncharacterized protein n=1 Tax=Portunus trituberculatus TaxID=210409 RepID=A0A5B7GPJ0_PORTR|nr:hypothetical protein [Portunus trituberculatus]